MWVQIGSNIKKKVTITARIIPAVSSRAIFYLHYHDRLRIIAVAAKNIPVL